MEQQRNPIMQSLPLSVTPSVGAGAAPRRALACFEVNAAAFSTRRAWSSSPNRFASTSETRVNARAAAHASSSRHTRSQPRRLHMSQRQRRHGHPQRRQLLRRVHPPPLAALPDDPQPATTRAQPDRRLPLLQPAPVLLALSLGPTLQRRRKRRKRPSRLSQAGVANPRRPHHHERQLQQQPRLQPQAKRNASPLRRVSRRRCTHRSRLQQQRPSLPRPHCLHLCLQRQPQPHPQHGETNAIVTQRIPKCRPGLRIHRSPASASCPAHSPLAEARLCTQ